MQVGLSFLSLREATFFQNAQIVNGIKKYQLIPRPACGKKVYSVSASNLKGYIR